MQIIVKEIQNIKEIMIINTDTAGGTKMIQDYHGLHANDKLENVWLYFLRCLASLTRLSCFLNRLSTEYNLDTDCSLLR